MTQGILDASYAEDRSQRPEFVFRYRVRARIAAAAARDLMPEADSLRILDLGSAEGRTLLELDQVLNGQTLGVAELLGIEAASDLLANRPDLPPHIRIVRGDVTRLPDVVEAGTFDLVSALALLEHLSAPGKAISEAARALRSGGLFVATCPHPFWDAVSTRLGLLAEDQHELRLDREILSALVAEAGLELLTYRRFMWAPVGFLPYLKIRVSPELALAVDRWIGAIRLFDGLFVNQAVIARKP